MINTRRGFLTTACISGFVALTGCTGDGGSSNPTSTSNPSTVLAFSSNVVQQPSNDSPGRIGATLENVGSKSVEVGYGATLLYYDWGSGDTAWSGDEILLDPETYVGPWSDPVQTDDGCWRSPEDGEINVEGVIDLDEIGPNEVVDEEYEVYTNDMDGPCLPAGTYQYENTIDITEATDEGELSEPRQALLGLELTVDSQKELSSHGYLDSNY